MVANRKRQEAAGGGRQRLRHLGEDIDVTAEPARTGAVHVSVPLGVVVRKTPGVTRWAAWAWKAVAVLPGAGQAHWKELRREGEAVEYHAATLDLTLWAAETVSWLPFSCLLGWGWVSRWRSGTPPGGFRPVPPTSSEACTAPGVGRSVRRTIC